MLLCTFLLQDPIMSREERALNFVIHEYLMQRDNKLTAITFTEENVDQVRSGDVREGCVCCVCYQGRN